MSGFVMFFSVIAGAVVLFAGSGLRRFLLPIGTVVTFVVATILIMLVCRAPEPAWHFPEVLRYAGDATMPLTVGALIAAALAALSVRFVPKFASICTDVLFGALSSYAGISVLLPHAPLITIASVLGIGIAFALWHLFDATRYLIITSSMVGSIAVALLFTRFYYLPMWVCILIALLLTLTGISTQTHRRDKRSDAHPNEHPEEHE